MTPTNEQIAAWLDPDRKRDGWWTVIRIPVGNKPMQLKYIGPDFYLTSVCAEEVEPVVLAAGCQYRRNFDDTEISIPFNAHFNEIVNHEHHPTACILALAKIKGADHA